MEVFEINRSLKMLKSINKSKLYSFGLYLIFCIKLSYIVLCDKFWHEIYSGVFLI